MTDTPRTDTDRDALNTLVYEIVAALDDHAGQYGPVTSQGLAEAAKDAILASDWLAAHDAEVRRQALAAVEPHVHGPEHYTFACACGELMIGRQYYLDHLRAAVDAADPTAHDRAVVRTLEPDDDEPPFGSIVLAHGRSGTAFQRFYSDGDWHGTNGQIETWAGLNRVNRRANPKAVLLLVLEGEPEFDDRADTIEGADHE